MNTLPYTHHAPLVAGVMLNGHWRARAASVLTDCRARMLVASPSDVRFTLLLDGVTQPEVLHLAPGQLFGSMELSVPVAPEVLMQWRCETAGGMLATLVLTAADATSVDSPPREVWWVHGEAALPVLSYGGSGVFESTVHAPGRVALTPDPEKGPEWWLDGASVAVLASGTATALDWHEYPASSGTGSRLEFRLGARVLAVLGPDGLRADRLLEQSPVAALDTEPLGFEFYEGTVRAAALDRLGFRAGTFGT